MRIRANNKSINEVNRDLRRLQTALAGQGDVALGDLTVSTLTIDSLNGLLLAVNGLVSGLVGGAINDVPKWNGTTWVPGTVMSAGGAPVDATFLTLTGNATLTNERAFTLGTGLTAVDTGANGTYTLSVNPEVTQDAVAAMLQEGYDTDLTYNDPVGTLTVAGSTAVATKTANYSMGLDDRVILADATSGSLTVLLPPVGAAIGRIYYIKRINQGPNTVTIDTP